MKSNLFTCIILTSAILFNFNIVSAQKNDGKMNPVRTSDLGIKNVSLENYTAFKASVKPLIQKMGMKQIVGLGEGTHGTAEFNKVRFWITRILIEEKGFSHIVLENDFSDTWMLNDSLNKTSNLTGLMKNHLMSLWQNEEVKELLEWVKEYNLVHGRKVVVGGMDFPLLKPDVEVILTLLNRANNTALLPLAQRLLKAAALQDEAWIGMNHEEEYKGDMKIVSAGSKKGYITADSLEKQVNNLNLPANLKADLQGAVANLKQGFEPFYSTVEEGKRDSIMAHNISISSKGSKDKMIVWAHNAHVAKTGIYGNEVGGTGGYIIKLFPNNYFVLGTGTANGTFAGTTEPRPVNNNVMKAYSLEAPIKDSWESLMNQGKAESFYFDPMRFNGSKEEKSLRFVGFGIKSGASTYDKTNLIDLFDAFLFIRDTHASTPLK